MLLGTVAFFAIWMVALKPQLVVFGRRLTGRRRPVSVGDQQGPSGGHDLEPGQRQAGRADRDHVGHHRRRPRPAAPTATTPAPAKTAAKPTAEAAAKAVGKALSVRVTKPVLTPAQSAAADAKSVETAIRAGKVVAILFYNDAAADDRAMKTELAAVPTHGGKVVKLAEPVSQLIQFSVAHPARSPSTPLPTLVLIDAARQASTLIGYADRVEIASASTTRWPPSSARALYPRGDGLPSPSSIT